MWRSLWRGLQVAFLRVAGFFRRRTPYGVLVLDLSGELAEETGEPRFFGLFRRSPTDYLATLTLLRWAREDPSLHGVLLRIDDIHASWARLQGLRRSVERLRAAGKRVWVHLERAGAPEYSIAAAADRVVMAPAATLDVTGLASEAIFLRDALDKLGVDAEVVQVGRYKSAGEMFSRAEMSPAQREMLEALVGDLYDQLVEGVAAGRRLDPAVVREQLGRGPFIAAEAIAAGLVDATGYADEVERALIDACGGPTIERAPYALQRGRAVRLEALRRARRTLALVHLGGTIKSGESGGRPGAGATGSSSLAAALKAVRERADIGAVVLRIASPGGSALASDMIWREVTRLRESKPVVVSCGDVAASGGYYVAIAGRPLLAEAGSITGSIGVVAGKATLRRLYDRLGVRKTIVGRGANAGLFSDYAPLDVAGRERIETQAAMFYRDFVAKVAAARGLSDAAAEAAAQGRVWTGRQAQARGLVDALGGLEEAFDAAKQAIGVPLGDPVMVERFPKPRPFWRLPFDLRLPGRGAVTDLLGIAPSLRYLLRERVWAILPFEIRFF
ncbi:MAG: S49 family peptidase [Deltaproteobacteria bacterium]|nr:S49 family peptidase [Deltaproteobacteria bacterium]